MQNERDINFSVIIALMIFVLFFLANSNYSFAQSKIEKIDELIKLHHDYGQFNGTVLVAEGGKVVFKKGYGFANMEWNIPKKKKVKNG